ncbi:hypothetical protein C8J56DRAFT_1052386 [Mycena floridula]|nr:hypothetical protein C8J56DRAFT_1052386 [Mycena floridula]
MSEYRSYIQKMISCALAGHKVQSKENMSATSQSSSLDNVIIYGFQEYLIEIGVAFFIHGIYLTLVAMTVYKLCTKKSLAAHKLLFIIVIFIMALLSTGSVALLLAYNLGGLIIYAFNPPDLSRFFLETAIVGDAMRRLNYMISDSIVVWRAWVLWPNHRWARCLLVLCLVGSFIGVCIDFTFVILFDLGNSKFYPTGPKTLILTLPLFATNLVSTLLIGYKVWEYRTEIKYNLGLGKTTRTKVERILILLTESGMIYCALWVPNCLVPLVSQDYDSLAYQLTVSVLPQLTAMYPIMIILLVTLEKASLQSTITAPTFSQPIQFASRPQIATETHETVEVFSTDMEECGVRQVHEKPFDDDDHNSHFIQSRDLV